MADTPAPSAVLDPKTTLRKEVFAAVDTITGEMNRRFQQPGMEKLAQLELTLKDAARRKLFTADDLREALGDHAADFQLCRLSAQFVLLAPLLSHLDTITVQSIVQVLQEKAESVCELLDQVVKYLYLLLPVPASAASGERSFSALRHIKTYLRSRMTQGRLTHLLLLHVHKERAAAPGLDDIIREFLGRTAERTATFGS